MRSGRSHSPFSEFLYALLLIAVGAVMAFLLKSRPNLAVALIGGGLLLIGLVRVFRFFMSEEKHLADVLSLLIGVAAMVGAVLVFANIGPVMDLGAILLGAYLALSGLLRLLSAVRLGKRTGRPLTLAKALSLVEILCGVFCIASRPLLPEAMFQAAGVALMIFGALDVGVILSTAGARRELQRKTR